MKKLLKISVLLASVAFVAAQKPQEAKAKNDSSSAKRYRDQEPHFKPPPLPIQRKLQVVSGPESPPSFFPEEIKSGKAESRQFEVRPIDQLQLVDPTNTFEEVPLNQNQFQQFNQPKPQQQPQVQQNFQQFEQEKQQQDNNNFQTFQSRQQETLPTLPPVFIPPNNPVGPPPQLQSPIRNLFREPEPSFSLAGLLQRFLRLFNLGNN